MTWTSTSSRGRRSRRRWSRSSRTTGSSSTTRRKKRDEADQGHEHGRAGHQSGVRRALQPLHQNRGRRPGLPLTAPLAFPVLFPCIIFSAIELAPRSASPVVATVLSTFPGPSPFRRFIFHRRIPDAGGPLAPRLADELALLLKESTREQVVRAATTTSSHSWPEWRCGRPPDHLQVAAKKKKQTELALRSGVFAAASGASFQRRSPRPLSPREPREPSRHAPGTRGGRGDDGRPRGGRGEDGRRGRPDPREQAVRAHDEGARRGPPGRCVERAHARLARAPPPSPAPRPAPLD